MRAGHAGVHIRFVMGILRRARERAICDVLCAGSCSLGSRAPVRQSSSKWLGVASFKLRGAPETPHQGRNKGPNVPGGPRHKRPIAHAAPPASQVCRASCLYGGWLSQTLPANPSFDFVVARPLQVMMQNRVQNRSGAVPALAVFQVLSRKQPLYPPLKASILILSAARGPGTGRPCRRRSKPTTFHCKSEAVLDASSCLGHWRLVFRGAWHASFTRLWAQRCGPKSASKLQTNSCFCKRQPSSSGFAALGFLQRALG